MIFDIKFVYLFSLFSFLYCQTQSERVLQSSIKCECDPASYVDNLSTNSRVLQDIPDTNVSTDTPINSFKFSGTRDSNNVCVCDKICLTTQVQTYNSNENKFICTDQTSNDEDDNTNISPAVNTIRIDPNSELLYVVSLMNRGPTLPSTKYLGKYEQGTNDNNEEIILSDPFMIQWNTQNEQYTDVSVELLKNTIVPNLRNLYFNDGGKGYSFLNTSRTNEIAFVSMSNEDTVWYLKYLITNLYNTTSLASTPDYVETDFIKGIYNEETVKVAKLSSDLSKYEYGFSYNECTKSKLWVNYAENLDEIKTHYADTFKSVITSFVKNAETFSRKRNTNISEDDVGYFYSSTGSLLYNITFENLLNNMEDMQDLVKLYLADYAYDPNTMKKLTDTNYETIKTLYRFFNYEINTYSMMHTYLTVQPLLRRIESIFIDIIGGTQVNYPKNSKMLVYSANDYIFMALNKLINYNSDDYTNKDSFYYQNTTYSPYIDYNYNIQFELWKNKTNSPNTYYVTLRENMNNKNKNVTTWLKGFTEFQDWLSSFYDSVGYDQSEREYFCEPTIK